MAGKNSLAKFADQINAIMPTLMREFGRNKMRLLSMANITFPQFFILDHLNRQGESTMTGLAKFMDVSTAAMTGTIDRLVEAGYCQRFYDSRDRRLIRMKLTSRGQEIAKKVNEERRRSIIDMFSMLSEKERKDYLRILLRINEIISSNK